METHREAAVNSPNGKFDYLFHIVVRPKEIRCEIRFSTIRRQYCVWHKIW